MSHQVHQQLESIYNTGDPALQDLAQRAIELKNMLEQGSISKSEFTELVNDLYHEKNINESVSDLQTKEMINSTMTALIALASLY